MHRRLSEVEVEVHKVAKMSKLNITEEEVMVLYSEAGREMNYCDQKFEYDKEITVTQQCKSRINKVLTDMEVNFQPAEFQVIIACLDITRRDNNNI